MEEVVGVVALQQDDHGFKWCLFKAVTSRATGLVWFLQSSYEVVLGRGE